MSLLCLLMLPAVLGCVGSEEAQVVVYTALDAEFSETILQDFTQETGIRARPKFDAESTKTLALTSAIMTEARRPRCDVFWNNEILNTLRLKERGLLEVYWPPAAEPFPKTFRDPDGTWTGFAARARILIVNTKLVNESDRPASIYDLARPKWKGRIGIAKPLFGTTATHVACLFAALGPEKAKEFFLDLRKNDARIEAGNKQVAISVAAGSLAFGLTDTDDALAMIDQGYPVDIVYPDRGQEDLGTLFIPNTLAIIKDCPHPEQARQLVDFLLGPEIEARLAEGPSGQIPLNPNVAATLRVETPRTVKPMTVDFAEAARQWDAASVFIRDTFFIAE